MTFSDAYTLYVEIRAAARTGTEIECVYRRITILKETPPKEGFRFVDNIVTNWSIVEQLRVGSTQCVVQWCINSNAGTDEDNVELYQYTETTLRGLQRTTLGSWRKSFFIPTRHSKGFDFSIVTHVLSKDQKSIFLFTGGHDGGGKLWQIDVNNPTKLQYIDTLPGSYVSRPAEERQQYLQLGSCVRVNAAGFSSNGEWLFVEWDNGKIALFHPDSTGKWIEQPNKIKTQQCNRSCFVLDDGTVRSLYNNDLQLPDSAVSKAKPAKK